MFFPLGSSHSTVPNSDHKQTSSDTISTYFVDKIKDPIWFQFPVESKQVLASLASSLCRWLPAVRLYLVGIHTWGAPSLLLATPQSQSWTSFLKARLSPQGTSSISLVLLCSACGLLVWCWLYDMASKLHLLVKVLWFVLGSSQMNACWFCLFRNSLACPRVLSLD